MVKIIKPYWLDFEHLIKKAKYDLLVCTPFYSEEGINYLFDHIGDKVAIKFVTRLSPSDWLNGISDPKVLLIFFELMKSDHRNVDLIIHQRLHAKAYIADNSYALMGSSNLSGGGFELNFELMVEGNANLAEDMSNLINTEIKEYGRTLTFESFKDWVERNEENILSLRSAHSNVPEDLSNAQKELDEKLGYGRSKVRSERYYHSEIDKFVDWLARNRDISGAELLLDRYQNKDGQNLTGHFRQSFYGSMNFLDENRKYIEILSREIIKIEKDKMFQFDLELQKRWQDHMDENSTQQTEQYSYPVLRGILPPSLGGTRLGGGGGSSTIKRMLPLVAKFMDEVKNGKKE
jgi:HKD family nuclease